MRDITDPYLVYNKETNEPVLIQRDGYYPPEVISKLCRHSSEVEAQLINSGFYEKVIEEMK